MATYDFANLSPYDFELLVRDLLARELNANLETFTAGRDQGIDARWLAPRSQKLTLMVQCKLWKPSGFDALVSELKKTEYPKIARLKPARYILATSIPLTPNRKEVIADVLKPYVLTPADVRGREDLNNALRDHPDVEKAHYKLWLGSTEVMQRLLHSEIYVRSEKFRSAIMKDIVTYVPNANLAKARQLLTKEHVCLISGHPGIGKTTLANILLLDHLGKDWEAIEISRDISEGFEVWNDDLQQIFYYDDFLGRVGLGSFTLAKNEEVRLMDFAHIVRNSHNKRLVLTTREYILAAAELRFDRLDERILALYKCLMQPADYTRWERALILYNHLAASKLSEAATFGLIEGRTYLKVIDHRNYSPRLVSYMTESPQAEAAALSKSFPAFVLRVLDRPEELWSHAIENQLDEMGRATLAALVSLPSKVAIGELERATEEVLRLTPTKPEVDFYRGLKVLEGTFLEISRHNGQMSVDFRDPSVLDFMLFWLRSRAGDLRRLCQACVYFEQVETLTDYRAGRVKRRDTEYSVETRSLPDLPMEASDLADAFLRCLRSRKLASQIGSIGWSATGEEPDIVARVRVIVEFAIKSADSHAIAVSRDLIVGSNEDMAAGRLTTRGIMPLTLIQTKVPQLREPLQEIALECLNALSTSPSSLTTFDSIADLHRVWPALFDKARQDALQEIIEDRLDHWLDEGKDESDDSGLQSIIDTIGYVANEFQVDASSVVEELEEHRAEIAHEDADPGDYDDDRDREDWGFTATEPGPDGDAAIDGLFGTLN